MTVAWPTILPLPQLEGFAEGSGDPRRFTKPEQGVPRARRRSSRVARQVRASITVLHSRRATFDLFWSETTNEGAEPFTMPDPGRDGLALADENDLILLDENDLPLLQTETWLCLFGDGGHDHRPRGGGIWDISFPLIVLP